MVDRSGPACLHIRFPPEKPARNLYVNPGRGCCRTIRVNMKRSNGQALLAQLVEHIHGKNEVTRSIRVEGSRRETPKSGFLSTEVPGSLNRDRDYVR